MKEFRRVLKDDGVFVYITFRVNAIHSPTLEPGWHVEIRATREALLTTIFFDEEKPSIAANDRKDEATRGTGSHESISVIRTTTLKDVALTPGLDDPSDETRDE